MLRRSTVAYRHDNRPNLPFEQKAYKRIHLWMYRSETLGRCTPPSPNHLINTNRPLSTLNIINIKYRLQPVKPRHTSQYIGLINKVYH